MKKLALMICLIGCLAASTASAAILNPATTAGLNTINDTNGDRYIPAPGSNGSRFSVGDTFESVLVFDNITNAAFFNTDLDDAVGNPAYRLQAVSRLTISAILNDDPGNPNDLIDLALTGTVDIYETTSAANYVNFLTDSFASAMTKVTTSTLILSLASDFYQQPNAPPTVAGVPNFPGLVADGGFHIVANPGAVPIAPNATPTTYVDINTAALATTMHDVVARIQLFRNSGANAGPTGFPLLSDTTVQFTRVVPEPASAIAWLGLLGAVSTVAAFRWRK